MSHDSVVRGEPATDIPVHGIQTKDFEFEDFYKKHVLCRSKKHTTNYVSPIYFARKELKSHTGYETRTSIENNPSHQQSLN